MEDIKAVENTPELKNSDNLSEHSDSLFSLRKATISPKTKPKRNPRKPKKPKRVTKAKLKKKARASRRKRLVEWSLAVRARDGHKCVICGASDFLNAHHLIPKERFPSLQFEIENGLSLCPSHHKFGSFSAHRHTLWFAVWVSQNRPQQYQWVMDNMHIPK